jgi:hypothetical protein
MRQGAERGTERADRRDEGGLHLSIVSLREGKHYRRGDGADRSGDPVDAGVRRKHLDERLTDALSGRGGSVRLLLHPSLREERRGRRDIPHAAGRG